MLEHFYEVTRYLTKALNIPPNKQDCEMIEASSKQMQLSLRQFHTEYLDTVKLTEFMRQWKTTCEKIEAMRITPMHHAYPLAAEFLQTYHNMHNITAEHNAKFVEHAKVQYNALLSNIDGKSLDEQQRTVVCTDAHRNLVLAGAGAGKTLTIAGKVKYLCETQHIKPEDILLIGFTKKSAEEMTDRISNKLGIPITATTFHKLGLDIIVDASHKRPEVVDDLTEFVREYFEKHIVTDAKQVENLMQFFAYYLHLPADMDDFDSLGAAYAFEKSLDFETMQSKYNRAQYTDDIEKQSEASKTTIQGELVKSQEEVMIANFLFMHGIRYEYEKKYPYAHGNKQFKEYHPDFYLPDYDIWIEHFGVNKSGHCPWLSPIEEAKYLSSMQWKRDIHAQYRTQLLETYSHYNSDGVLLQKLEEMLKENDVHFSDVNVMDIFNAVYLKESDKYFAEFMKLCCTFITLFKSNGYTLEELNTLNGKSKRSQNVFFRKRIRLFKDVVKPIIAAYNQYLEELHAIDFSDMINQATSIVKGDYKVHPYKWVIIDEFQDISVARYKLVDAILQQTNAKLLCVGDDWQSIYRFTGSDITLFTKFQKYFGQAEIMPIERTYRNSQQLIDVAGSFITQNPNQMKKSLKSYKNCENPVRIVGYYSNPFTTLQHVINDIARKYGEESSILLLGRTQHDFKMIEESGLFDIKTPDRIKLNTYPNMKVSFLTVHKAKGLEADNVILLNFENATLGFPNKISDDPMLELVLTQEDVFVHAEERRLLYVALTRTRNLTYILMNEAKPSEFFYELDADNNVTTKYSGETFADARITCPRCKTGLLLVRKNEATNHYFVGCDNYPQCDYTVPQTSILTDTEPCPECGGFMVDRVGKHGKFRGCTNYPLCTNTRNVY